MNLIKTATFMKGKEPCEITHKWHYKGQIVEIEYKLIHYPHTEFKMHYNEFIEKFGTQFHPQRESK